LLAFSTVIWNAVDIHAAVLVGAIPLSVMISGYFANRKKVSLVLELIFLCWLLLAFANNLLSPAC
jgi:surface polysaccharide O-acyltransferase-like enzyme